MTMKSLHLVKSRTVSRDIAERRRAQEALKESEERFRTLSDASFEGIAIHEKGTILEVNQAFYRVCGYERSELIGQSTLGLVTPEYRRLVMEKISTEDPNPYEVVALRKDGTTVIVEVRGKPIHYQGHAARIIAVRDITERKKEEQELQRRASEFTALFETARDLSVQHDLPSLMQTIVERAMSLMNVPFGTIYLYDPLQNDLQVAAAKGIPLAPGTRLKLNEGMAAQTIRNRQTVIVDDYHSWTHRRSNYDGMNITAAMQAPLLYRGELIGILGVSIIDDKTRKFDEADSRLLSLFAEYAASAVHDARLFDDANQRLAELEAVNRISTALRAAQSLDEMIPRLMDETLAILNAGAGVIMLQAAGRNELCATISRGWFASLVQTPIPVSEGIAGHVFATGQAYYSNEFKSDPLTKEAMRPSIPEGWSGVCVPIRAERESVGVIFVSVEFPRNLTAAEVGLLTTLAEIAGNAIYRARLHERTKERLQRLAALHQIDTTISSSFELKMSLNVLLDQVLLQLGVDATSIFLLNRFTQTFEYSTGRGFRTRALESLQIRLGEGAAGRAALEDKVISFPDLTDQPEILAKNPFLASESFASYFAAPLIAKGEVKGLLKVFKRSPFTPDPEWLDFLETLATQAAIAIDSAQLFQGLQRSNMELALAYDSTLEGWSRALDLRGQEAEGHTRRVTEMTVRLARALGIKEAELAHIRRGALLHDIGKMAIPDALVHKADKLTEEEWQVMRRHTTYAYELLSPITYLRPSLDIPYCHHEHWDGMGHPRGLKGQQIPFAARIFAVVDAWDGCLSGRPHEEPWDERQTRNYLSEQSGKLFDPQVVEAFLKMDWASP